MSSRHPTVPVLSVLLASLFAMLPAHALYKVVGPDGKITYTDQPPTDGQNKVQTVNERGGAGTSAALPYELRQVVQKYPVTLYTSSESCTPCDAGRQLLQERGIPYAERTIGSSRDDVDAITRLTGGTSLPSVAIGGQVLRGFQRTDWSSYLDVAGYPKTSKLPPGYAPAKPQPLTEKKEVVAPAAQRTAPAPTGSPSPAPAPQQGPSADNPTGIRF